MVFGIHTDTFAIFCMRSVLSKAVKQRDHECLMQARQPSPVIYLAITACGNENAR